MKEDSQKVESEEVQIDVGQRIKKLRLSKGLSQAEVAGACDISQSAYAKIESGKTKNITIDIGRSIAQFLGIRFMDLFDISYNKHFTYNTYYKNTIAEHRDILLDRNKELEIKINEKNTLINTLLSEKKNLKDFFIMQFVSHYNNYIGVLEDLIEQAPNETFKTLLYKKRKEAIRFEIMIQNKFFELGLFHRGDIIRYIEEMEMMGIHLKDINEME